MAKKQAIRPVYQFSTLPTFVKDAEADKRGMAEDEIVLAGMAESRGWRILSEFLDSIVGDLDQLNENAIANGANYEEIGRNTLVITMTKGIIKKIVDKVEDAKEARNQELDEKANKPAGKTK